VPKKKLKYKNERKFATLMDDE